MEEGMTGPQIQSEDSWLPLSQLVLTINLIQPRCTREGINQQDCPDEIDLGPICRDCLGC